MKAELAINSGCISPLSARAPLVAFAMAGGWAGSLLVHSDPLECSALETGHWPNLDTSIGVG